MSKRPAKKEDKPTDIYLFEKEKDEYTFAPKISKEKPEEDQVMAGDIEKTIERLAKARNERERVKKALERISGDTSMKFTVEKGKYKGTFNQFSNSQKGSIKKSTDSIQKSVSMAPEEKKSIGSAQPPFSREFSPQEISSTGEDVAKRGSQPGLYNSADPNQNAAQDGVPREALLFIDVNLGKEQQRIIVFKGDTASQLADKFAKENSIYSW